MGAAQCPLILIFADYFLAHREPGAELFLLGIFLGAFIGVLAGAKLTGRVELDVLGRSYPYALLFGVPASLFCRAGLMMGGGSPVVGAVFLAIYVAAQWIALALWARKRETR